MYYALGLTQFISPVSRYKGFVFHISVLKLEHVCTIGVPVVGNLNSHGTAPHLIAIVITVLIQHNEIWRILQPSLKHLTPSVA